MVLIGLYSFALFLSASLLFSIQPMVGKWTLPWFGGAPAVWNTCLLFFQSVLLFGYGYAHLSCRWLNVRVQLVLHLVLMAIAFLMLPISLSVSGDVTQSPVYSLLKLLTLSIGLPVFLISSTGSLLQRWFAETSHQSARDPYFLYAASNLGSLAALLAYPLIIESTLRLQMQGKMWAWGYGLLVVLIGICAIHLWMNRSNFTENTAAKTGSTTELDGDERQLTWTLRVRWILLAFVPSSWMMGVTTYATTDLTPVPLLWVIPLVLYLLTFIVAFARRTEWIGGLMVRMLPIGVVLLVVSQLSDDTWFRLGLHLAVFVVGALMCHGELAKSRPMTSHLTEFYWWISAGGACGGLLNALIAPLVFTWPVEYALTVGVCCGLLPNLWSEWPERRKLLAGALVFVVAVALILREINPSLTMTLAIGTIVGFILLLGCYARNTTLGFAVIATLVLGLASVEPPVPGEVLYTGRSFFGVHRVVKNSNANFHQLVHGQTIHGLQSRKPGRECTPTAYYAQTGPLGEVFERLGKDRTDRVGVIGLGAGTVACYASSNREITFYEIDPIVAKIASTPEYFSYLSACGDNRCEIVLGDGRQEILAANDGAYDLLVLDAFSSDAIPMHLLTLEAMQVYLNKTSENGVIAFHVSNQYLNLPPVIAAAADQLDLICYMRQEFDEELSAVDNELLKAGSTYVIVGRNRESLAPILNSKDRNNRWTYLRGDARLLWTDDFSNLMDTLRW